MYTCTSFAGHIRLSRQTGWTLSAIQKKSLQILWNDLDVDVIRLYYLNLLAVPGWYFKSRILKVSKQANLNYKIMNTFLPVVAMLESICHPPLGLSLVAVIEKRKIPNI